MPYSLAMLDLIDDETYATCTCDPVVVRLIPGQSRLYTCVKCGAMYRDLTGPEQELLREIPAANDPAPKSRRAARRRH